jgi:ribosomal-protein-alanine N-acetyltransferase
VEPDRRRRGEGRAILGAFEARARGLGGTEAVLEVSEANTPARVLYAGAGWTPIGRRPRYYADGRDAIVLRKAL